MANTEALVLQMSADIRRMEKALNQARGQTNRQLSAVESRFDKMNDHVRRSGDSMARDLRSSVAAIGTVFAVRDLANAADQWTNLRNQVRGYTAVVGPVGPATERLVRVANDAGIAVGSLGTTFAASARAAKTLGASGDQVFAFNEAVAKGAAIASTSSAALDGALIQLGQAIGSPRVELQEFNSVIEGTPRLAQAFADGVKGAGGSVATLRQMIAKGDISGADLFQGLLSQLPTLRREFAASEATISRSINRLGNEFIQYVGNADRATGATQLLSQFIELVTDNFDLLADAAIVAAGVIGGALAVGAMGRAVTAIRAMTREARVAQTAMGRLGVAFGFFTGPVGGILLGIASALTSMAFSAAEGATAMEQADEAISKLGEAQRDIVVDTEALTAAQNRLTQAIKDNSAATQTAAIADIEAIRKRIAANKDLAITERVRLNEAKAAREKQFREEKPANLDGPLQKVFGLSGQAGSGAIPLEEAVRLMQDTFRRSGGDPSLKAIRESLARRSAQGPLDEQYSVFLDILTRYDQYQADLQKIDDALRAVTAMDSLGTGATLTFPDTPEVEASTRAVAGYRTELEQLNEVLGALRTSSGKDRQVLTDMRAAFAEIQNAADPQSDAAAATIQQRGDQLMLFDSQAGENARQRSRQAVEAVLAYARATGEIAATVAKIPSLADVLLGADESLLRNELKAIAQEGLNSILTGEAKLEADYAEKVASAGRIRDNALAAGLDAWDAYFARVAEAKDTLDEARMALWDARHKYDGIAGSGDILAGMPTADTIADDIRKQWERDGLIPTEAYLEMERTMRESVKNAMRDGIATGDWGDAFQSILADAITEGLDSALNRVADWLTNFLFAESGFLSGLMNGAGAWASSAIFGARAGGGGVGANRGYRVNDRADQGEFLFMGSNPGQVLRGSDIAGMMGPGQGASAVHINAPLIVEGSVDAVTWPKLEAAMRAQTRQIMTAMPGVVNATITDNRIQKRRL